VTVTPPIHNAGKEEGTEGTLEMMAEAEVDAEGEEIGELLRKLDGIALGSKEGKDEVVCETDGNEDRD